MYKLVEKLARLFAFFGGLVLSAMIVMTCLSIIGRSINGLLHNELIYSLELSQFLLASGVGPIYGDFELIEAGMAFTIFAFIPLCQLHGAHASVDLISSKLTVKYNKVLQLIIDVVFAAVLILIAVKLFEGMQSKMRSGQTTQLLQLPLWYAYAASLLSAIVAAVVGAYIALVRMMEMGSDTKTLPTNREIKN